MLGSAPNSAGIVLNEPVSSEDRVRFARHRALELVNFASGRPMLLAVQSEEYLWQRWGPLLQRLADS